MLQIVRHARGILNRFALATPSVALVLAGLCFVIVSPTVRATAQNGIADLPAAILEKGGAWSAGEARQVETFLNAHLAAFELDDAEAVADARDQILKPLNILQASPAFQSQYFRALAAALRNGLPNYGKPGRINAMLLGARVVDPAAVPLLELGLGDDWPGVRYATARSLLVVINNEAMGLQTAERSRLAEKLGQAAQVETNGYVAGKLIEGLRNLNVPAQRTVLLDVFNARVPLHAANPTLTYQPELSAMQELFIQGLGAPGGFNRDAAKTFIQAAARYLLLTTAQLDAGQLDAPNDAVAVNLVRQTHTILDTLAPNAGQAGQRPADPTRFLPDNPARAAELAQQWAAFLADAPLSLDAQALSIEPPAE